MFDAQTLAFAGLALLLTVTPGSDTLLVVRSVMTRGRRAGFFTTAGISAGVFVHALLSGAGLSALLVRSAAAFEAVKLAGAVYLVYLGGAALWGVWRQRGQDASLVSSGGGASSPVGARRAFAEGFLTNLLNPKVAVFYLALLPQFIGPGDPVLAKSVLLAAIHVGMGLVWLSLVTVLLGRLSAFVANPRVQRRLEAISGIVLVGLGLRLATSSR